MGVFLLFGRAKGPDVHRTARPRFSPLSAGSSVLDALWILAIIFVQPAYALVDPSGPSAWDQSVAVQAGPAHAELRTHSSLRMADRAQSRSFSCFLASAIG